MERVCRPCMSTAEKAEVWRRWKRGEAVSDIGRALGRFRKSVHRVVAAHGGVPPRARTRSRCALTVAERVATTTRSGESSRTNSPPAMSPWKTASKPAAASADRVG